MLAYHTFFYILTLITVVVLGFVIPVSNVLTNICVVILLLAWCFSDVKSRITSLINSKATIFILIFLMIYCLGIIYTPAQSTEICLMLRKMSRLLLIPIIMSLVIEEKWRKYALYGFFGGIILSFFIMSVKIFNWEFFTVCFKRHGLFHPDYNVVAFKDRIFTSLFFGFAVFAFLHFGIDTIKQHHFIKNKDLKANNIPLLAGLSLFMGFLCFIYLIVFCDGRSGQIIFLGLLELFLLQRKTSWSKFILYSVILCGSTFVLYYSAHSRTIGDDRYKTTIREAKEYFATQSKSQNLHSTGLRLEFFKNSLRLVKDSPIIGYGTGSFSTVYNLKFPLHYESGMQRMVYNPHNQYMLVAVELGLVGLIAMLAMFITLWLECRKLPSFEKFLAQGIILSIMVGCMANSWLMDFTSMHFFVYFMGLCLAAKPHNQI